MTFRVVHQPSANQTRCPYRVIVQTTGREIDWINQYLDYETLRRLADNTLKSYAHELLHFLRWWESVHHTDAINKEALTESTLLDYVRFQSSQDRELTGGTINQRVAIVDHALRIVFPDAPGQIAPGFQQTYWQRAPMGIGRPRLALSRLRVKARCSGETRASRLFQVTFFSPDVEMFSGISTSSPYGLPSTWSSIHFSSCSTDSGECAVAPSTPKPPARLTAATTSRQWLKASSGNSIPSMSQIGDFMVVLTPCGSFVWRCALLV